MNPQEELYFNGCVFGSFKRGKVLDSFHSTLKDIGESRVKNGYTLEQKYSFSKDLRPRAYDYDPSILDILFDSKIPEFIRSSLGYDLYLAHVQIRTTYPFPDNQKNRSYMEWHRDTHWYDGEIHGNAPPIYKIIYYPELNGVQEQTLMVSPGSHLRIMSNLKHDYEQLRANKVITIGTSLDKFLFFNTSMFHSTLPAHKNGTLRVIYNFCLKTQLEKYKEQKDLHDIFSAKLGE